MLKDSEVVLKGSWLYGEKIKCEIEIVRWHILYGTGDYEDEELEHDREVECYYTFLESILQKGKFDSRRGGFLSIKEAKEDVEEIIKNINWYL